MPESKAIQDKQKCVKKYTLVAQMGPVDRDRPFKTFQRLFDECYPTCLVQFTVVLSQTNANDPSAGSPTETLLRLLLPLNDQV